MIEELKTFLLDEIANDEAVLQRVREDAVWVVGKAGDDGVEVLADSGHLLGVMRTPDLAEFVAGNDPGRLLDDCAALREAVQVASGSSDSEAGLTVLRHLARRYETRPGYRDEWWPEGA